MKHQKNIQLFLFLSISFLVSCMQKTEEDIIKEKYSDEICKELIDKDLSQFMTIKWDSTYLHVYSPKGYAEMIIIGGEGTCREYDNERFRVESFWNIDRPEYHCTLLSLCVFHEIVGKVIDYSGDELFDSIMDCDRFRMKIKEHHFNVEWHRYISSVAAEERVDAVRLAHQNKTKVHFGMSELDHYASEKEFQKNFIDGLIGEGAYELSEPIYGKGKFVGFEIKSKHGHTCGHENIFYRTEIVNRRSYDVNRFHITEIDCASDFHNMRIYERTNGSSGEYSETITVLWNSYSKRYIEM